MVPAQEIGALLREACAGWSLDEASVAARAGIPVDAVQAALRGDADTSDLQAVARALGGTLDDLLAGRRFWQAPAVAFKSAPSTFELELVRAALLRTSSAARERASLTELLELPEPARMDKDRAAFVPQPLEPDVTAQAETLARRVREYLGNPEEPIASVRDAMRRLGVWTFLTDMRSPSRHTAV